MLALLHFGAQVLGRADLFQGDLNLLGNHALKPCNLTCIHRRVQALRVIEGGERSHVVTAHPVVKQGLLLFRGLLFFFLGVIRALEK
jgi:hypothetical protein